MEKGEIRIASKDASAYVKAVLLCLDNGGEATIKALGGRQNKLIEVLTEGWKECQSQRIS